jgi:hypothetical protein
MTLHPIPCEFPYIQYEENFVFFFISAGRRSANIFSSKKFTSSFVGGREDRKGLDSWNANKYRMPRSNYALQQWLIIFLLSVLQVKALPLTACREGEG